MEKKKFFYIPYCFTCVLINKCKNCSGNKGLTPQEMQWKQEFQNIKSTSSFKKAILEMVRRYMRAVKMYKEIGGIGDLLPNSISPLIAEANFFMNNIEFMKSMKI